MEFSARVTYTLKAHSATELKPLIPSPLHKEIEGNVQAVAEEDPGGCMTKL